MHVKIFLILAVLIHNTIIFMIDLLSELRMLRIQKQQMQPFVQKGNVLLFLEIKISSLFAPPHGHTYA